MTVVPLLNLFLPSFFFPPSFPNKKKNVVLIFTSTARPSREWAVKMDTEKKTKLLSKWPKMTLS